MAKSGDWEKLLLMSILLVLWLTMTEYGYLADPTIENGVRSQEVVFPLTLTLIITLTLVRTPKNKLMELILLTAKFPNPNPNPNPDGETV